MPVTPLRHGLLEILAAGTVASALALGLAPDVRAQGVTGKVVEARTDRAVEGVEISILNADAQVVAQAVSDAEGHFAVRLRPPGSWAVAVRHVGYSPIQSELFEIEPGEWVAVQVSLDPRAILLDPIVVTGRRSSWSPAVREFYERRDGARRSGFGRFIAREDIERLAPFQPTDLLRTVAGVRVVPGRTSSAQGLRMTAGCVPAIFIDGMRINRSRPQESLDNYVSVMDIEGIEVYRGPSSQVGSLHDPSGCGLVLVWTRGGFRDPNSSFRWRTVLGVVGILGAFLLFAN